GHGLSYTRFSYSRPKLARRSLGPGDEQTVLVHVTNNGSREGGEVIQLYVSAPGGGTVPLHSLKGFERIELKPSQSRVVQLKLSPRDLAVAEQDGTLRVRPGRYRLWIGGGQPGTNSPGAAATFEVSGSEAVEP
ncbi:MAG TPA: fibronectin type III-like domain-contianing protein, partial [Sphingomicrobium sp.]|nr:fibronectin type III-like domain-contianing protein [Sphingomicrobium sp.]